jgi:hypothetical protein
MMVCFPRATQVTLLVCTALLPIAGCNTAPPPAERADYATTLDKFYQGRPACVWPDTVKFPVEDATPDDIDERGFAALADAGLLIRKPASKGAPQGSYTYDLSPEGRSAIDPDIANPGAGNFCYGRRTVTSIDGASQNSRSTELIDFRYSVTQPAAWAKEDAIERAFPQVVSELAGTHKAEATLLDTTDGWEVSGTPAIITPLEAAPRNSALAKAKFLLHIRKKQSS